MPITEEQKEKLNEFEEKLSTIKEKFSTKELTVDDIKDEFKKCKKFISEDLRNTFKNEDYIYTRCDHFKKNNTYDDIDKLSSRIYNLCHEFYRSEVLEESQGFGKFLNDIADYLLKNESSIDKFAGMACKNLKVLRSYLFPNKQPWKSTNEGIEVEKSWKPSNLEFLEVFLPSEKEQVTEIYMNMAADGLKNKKGYLSAASSLKKYLCEKWGVSVGSLLKPPTAKLCEIRKYLKKALECFDFGKFDSLKKVEAEGKRIITLCDKSSSMLQRLMARKK